MAGLTIKLVGAKQRIHALRLVNEAEDDWIIEIKPPTRTLDQNAKLHPMLEDIRRQVEGMDAFTRDDIKLRFLNALGTEMRYLPELDGAGMFPVGLRSSTLTKAQFSLLIEMLYKYGAEHDVRWSDPKGRKSA